MGTDQKIKKLRDIEVLLGNIPVSESYLKALHERVHSDFYEEHQKELSELTETLFHNICEDFKNKGLNPKEISDTINETFQTDFSLSYCSEDEVKEALGDHEKA